MKPVKLVILLMAGFGLCQNVSADGRYRWHRDYRMEREIFRLLERQHARIEQGAADGRLTPREFRKLMRKHRKVVRLEERFTRDGWLSPEEARILRRKIHRLDDKILTKLYNRKRWRPRDDRWRGPRFLPYRPFPYFPAGAYDRPTTPVPPRYNPVFPFRFGGRLASER